MNKNGESFTVYMCIEGDFGIEYNNSTFNYKNGDTVLLPAAVKNYLLKGKASILEVYIS